MVGGFAGTLSRYGLTELGASQPVVTLLTVNTVGAFLLGLLLGSLSRPGPRTRAYRLLLGTGFLGGFTTYSAFSLTFAQNLSSLWVSLAAVALGLGAALVGDQLARALKRGGR